MPELKTNVLYYGDNLDILRNYIPDESVDLIYLDPPFNSKASYNVLFKEPTGEQSAAQIKAFEDTWHWDTAAEHAYQEIITKSPLEISKMVEAMRGFIGSNDMMAYLVMMTIRLVELRRVLKPTGSIYLHCDPTASHYLKAVMDTIFGKRNFINEIIWKRTYAHSDIKQGARHYGRIYDNLLFYAKGPKYVWHPVYQPYSDDYLASSYKKVETGTGRSYQEVDLTARKPGGDTEYEWKGVRPYKGRYWAYSKEKMQEFEKQGKLIYRKTGMPRLKVYLDEMPGVPAQALWLGIKPSGPSERLGYQTQKPTALLERIIRTSSSEGGIILDPFCGCGTAVVAAHKLNRRWIGIDITHLAIAVMRKRLKDSFPGIEFGVIGEPVDVEGAKALARQDRYQFQWWALSLIDAVPVEEKKKGADKGIDGISTFIDGPSRKAERAIVQVKSGHVTASQVRDLKGVMEREKAALGVFLTLDPPTEPMQQEAVTAGFHHSTLWQRDYPKIQILTVDELLQGKMPMIPGKVSGYAKAQKIASAKEAQLAMKETS